MRYRVRRLTTSNSEETPKEEKQGCEECESSVIMPMPMQFSPDQQELESRGIIVLNQMISKEVLQKALDRMLVLHFDQDFQDEIQIILNSPGGYVDAGWAFVDLMAWIKNPVRTVAVGEICSMATAIFIAGDYRVMTKNSMAMIHQFSSGHVGTYQDLLASRKFEDMEHHRHLDHLVKHSRYTKKQVEEKLLLDHDHYLSPKEMKDHGLCDLIVVPPNKMSDAKRKSLARKRKVKKSEEQQHREVQVDTQKPEESPGPEPDREGGGSTS